MMAYHGILFPLYVMASCFGGMSWNLVVIVCNGVLFTWFVMGFCFGGFSGFVPLQEFLLYRGMFLVHRLGFGGPWGQGLGFHMGNLSCNVNCISFRVVPCRWRALRVFVRIF